jgi:DMSO/TMAO reductase YedYZ molybdopterin-dependent catalytic subunit
MRNILFSILLLLLLSACAGTASPQVDRVVPACDLKPIKVPKMPAVIPEYMQLDRETGLHMTGTPQEIDLKTYRFLVTGLVEKPLSLRYDELRCLPKVTATPPLKCTGIFEDFVDTATWSGVPIAEILKLARPLPEAKSIYLVSADGYKVTVDLETAMKPENYLAYEWEGQPLPVLHGFPLRSVFPAKEGSHWVKWLVKINVNQGYF